VKFYDTDGDGSISYNEFLSGLKDELSERRLRMVKKAFQMLDRDSSGRITISDLTGIFDVSMNPEFLEGRKSRDQILGEFLDNFQGSRGNNDGCIEW